MSKEAVVILYQRVVGDTEKEHEKIGISDPQIGLKPDTLENTTELLTNGRGI
jgi:hypothetical protein